MKLFRSSACIIFYLVLGVILFFSPWASFWNQNFFLSHYPWLSPIGSNDFIRGAISGFGLVNIWMAIDAIHELGGPPGSIASRPVE